MVPHLIQCLQVRLITIVVVSAGIFVPGGLGNSTAESLTGRAGGKAEIPVCAVYLTPDGRLVSGSDDGLFLHDVQTFERMGQVESGMEKIYSIVASPDEKRIAVAGGTPADLGVVEVYALPEFKLLNRFERFDDIATDVAWRSNDEMVACSMSGDCCELQLIGEESKAFNVHSRSVLAIEVLNSASGRKMEPPESSTTTSIQSMTSRFGQLQELLVKMKALPNWR